MEKGSHLLVAGVDKVGEGLESICSMQASIPIGRGDVDSRVYEDGVDELRDAHMLQHLPHVLLCHVVPILRNNASPPKLKKPCMCWHLN